MPRMSPHLARTVALTAFALLAFAGNSLLCRWALDRSQTDPASFTTLRLASGALVLWLLVRSRGQRIGGDWPSAWALFVYAGAFSWAYTGLSAGTGALLLFGSVQATMLLMGLRAGARWSRWQWLGLALAMAGLVGVLMPGLSAPAPLPATLMLAAGGAWGVYTLRGRGVADATGATAGNFVRAVPLALIGSALAWPWFGIDAAGAACALVSGAVTSGLGYAVWYTALRGLTPQAAGSCQLSVPVITAVAGVLWLGESIGLRLMFGSAAVLLGIALTLPWRARSAAT
jgi:drug/metabolite transporter (DMT)-like permease